MIEMICEEIVFHFNKKHLEDPSVPMWVLKAKGKSIYVNHVSCFAPWSTKETPDNASTKGSIKIKKALLKIDDNNAEITTATEADIRRIKAQSKGYVRITWSGNQTVKRYLNSVSHTTIKKFNGGCGSVYYVCDIKSEEEAVAMELAIWGTFKRLLPTDYLYKCYDDPKLWEDDDD